MTTTVEEELQNRLINYENCRSNEIIKLEHIPSSIDWELYQLAFKQEKLDLIDNFCEIDYPTKIKEIIDQCDISIKSLDLLKTKDNCNKRYIWKKASIFRIDCSILECTDYSSAEVIQPEETSKLSGIIWIFCIIIGYFAAKMCR